ncbi:hypothetical protein GCM10009019_07300 [Salarchaeum japonicum]|uniref:Uncharacterized protein n=1 Tax=Salarchaeum japonicum TaxID=555573 RepID=A0AAV3SZ26_9EURY
MEEDGERHPERGEWAEDDAVVAFEGVRDERHEQAEQGVHGDARVPRRDAGGEHERDERLEGVDEGAGGSSHYREFVRPPLKRPRKR